MSAQRRPNEGFRGLCVKLSIQTACFCQLIRCLTGLSSNRRRHRVMVSDERHAVRQCMQVLPFET